MPTNGREEAGPPRYALAAARATGEAARILREIEQAIQDCRHSVEHRQIGVALAQLRRIDERRIAAAASLARFIEVGEIFDEEIGKLKNPR